MRKERLLAVILSFAALLVTGGKALAEENSAENPMIQEGRVWEYFKYDYKYMGLGDGERYIDICMLRYSFQGTETVNNKTYHRCILDEAVTWRSKKNAFNLQDPYDIERHEIGTCVGLVREEGQKVYMLLQSETVHSTYFHYLQLKSGPVAEGQETLLFDFGAQTGQTVSCYMTSYTDGPVRTQGEVLMTQQVQDRAGHSLSQVALRNIPPLDCMDTWDYWDTIVLTIESEWVEGVGNTGPGEMLRFGGVENYAYDGAGAPERSPRPEMGDPSDDIIELYCGRNSFFNNLYDADGTVVYAGLNQPAPATSGASSVIYDTPKNDAIYDLFGRKVEKMQPGSIYIIDGKKVTGK